MPDEVPAGEVTGGEPPRLRVKEAVRALERALGDRPFILVYELAHRNSEVSHLRVHEPPSQPIYVSLGLLRSADLLVGQEVKEREPGSGPETPP